MAEVPRSPDTGPESGSRWQLALQFIGAGAAIGAWIAVVGGARMWARLDTIGVPPAQTVSMLPRELLISEGLRTLAVPLLLGGAIAIVVYLSRRREEEIAAAAGHASMQPDAAVGASAAASAAGATYAAAAKLGRAAEAARKMGVSGSDLDRRARLRFVQLLFEFMEKTEPAQPSRWAELLRSGVETPPSSPED